MTCAVPVFYATSEGQTRKIALYLADRFRSRGIDSSAFDIESLDPASIDWTHVRAAVVGASIHVGKHQRQAVRFVRSERDRLNERPGAFFSVSLSAGSSHLEEVAAARALARQFIETTQWRADHVACFAGCIAYTKYGFVKKWLLQRIARKEGASTDTSRDHEYTNWTEVDRLVESMIGALTPEAKSHDAA